MDTAVHSLSDVNSILLDKSNRGSMYAALSYFFIYKMYYLCILQ